MFSHSQGHLPSHTPGPSFLQVNALFPSNSLESYGQRGGLLRGQGTVPDWDRALAKTYKKIAAAMTSPFFSFFSFPPPFHSLSLLPVLFSAGAVRYPEQCGGERR